MVTIGYLPIWNSDPENIKMMTKPCIQTLSYLKNTCNWLSAHFYESLNARLQAHMSISHVHYPDCYVSHLRKFYIQISFIPDFNHWASGWFFRTCYMVRIRKRKTYVSWLLRYSIHTEIWMFLYHSHLWSRSSVLDVTMQIRLIKETFECDL